jgi:hypothetical protein
VDSGNDEVKSPRLTIAADPLEVEPIAKLVAQATVDVSREVTAAVSAAVGGWTKQNEEQARAHVLAGQMPQAEEAYLKLMALGAPASEEMRGFFDKRYGRSADEVMAALALALGREPEKAAGGEAVAQARPFAFPRRELFNRARPPENKPVEALAPVVAPAPVPAPALPALPPKPKAKPTLSEDELKALEADSLAPAPAAPAPQTPEEKAAASGSGGDAQSSSAPIEPE